MPDKLKKNNTFLKKRKRNNFSEKVYHQFRYVDKKNANSPLPINKF